MLRLIKRAFQPAFLTTLYYALKYRCFVSLRAEVDMTRKLVIGRNTRISAYAQIKVATGTLRIGSDVAIGTGVVIGSHAAGITIGDDVLIGPHVTILGSNYRYESLDVPIQKQGLTSKGVTIGDSAWLGAGCVVLDGAAIGAGTIVTPNSVVSSELPANVIAQGNPAKVIFNRR